MISTSGHLISRFPEVRFHRTRIFSRRLDWIKGLLWEGDVFFKRLEKGKFQWTRNEQEVLELTAQQFRWLMEGLTLYQTKAITVCKPKKTL
jgi:transposase